MTTPRRNLPPDAEAWGRYVDEQILAMQKRLGIARQNVITVNRQGAIALSAAGDVKQKTEEIDRAVEIVREVADSKSVISNATRRPDNPKHGYLWQDPLDGNTPYIFSDYGDTERVNYLTNPSFFENVDGWTATGGSLVWLAERAARLTASGFVASVTSAFMPADTGTENSGVPWSGSGKITYLGTREDVVGTLQVRSTIDNVYATSEPVVLKPNEAVRLVAQNPQWTTTAVTIEFVVANAVSGDQFLIDEILLEKDSRTGVYFDGNSPGAYWDQIEGAMRSAWNGEPRWVLARDNKMADVAAAVAVQAAADAIDAAVVELDGTMAQLQQRLETAETDLAAAEGDIEDAKADLAIAFPGGAFSVEQRLAATVKNTSVEYAVNSSETTPPTTGWSTATPTRTPGTFVWFRTKVTYGDDTTTTTNPALLTGPKGDPGAPGVSVTAVTPYYRQQLATAAAPAKPTTATPSGWTTTEPAFAPNSALYRTEKITFSNSTFSYTDVVKVASYQGIDAAMAAANGKNLSTYTSIARGATIPAAPSTSGRVAGDTHRVRYTDNGEIVREWAMVGSAWQAAKFGNEVLTSLDVGKLSAGTATIETGVLNFLTAEIAKIIDLDVENLVVTGTSTVDTQVAEAIWAAKIAARKILAGEVLLGGTWNLLADPYFEDAKIRDIVAAQSDIVGSWGTNSSLNARWYGGSGQPTSRTKNFYFFSSPPATTYDTGAFIQVEPGEVYRMRATVNSSNGSARWTYRLIRADGSTNYLAATPYQTRDGVRTLEGELTIPADTRYVLFAIQFDASTSAAYVYGGAVIEKMITNPLIVDGGIVGRHMNIVEELPNGAKFSLQPDGMRVWAAGNNTTNPNVLLTLADGFRIQKPNGTSLAWINPSTGAFHTAGGVFSDSTIQASRFEGGEIEIETPQGAPVFHASPSGGVSIGGEASIYTRATVSSSAVEFDATTAIPITPGLAYRVSFVLERNNSPASQMHIVQARYLRSNGTTLGYDGVTYAYIAPTYGAGAPLNAVVKPPTGAATMILQVTKYSPDTGVGNTTRVTNISVSVVGPGDVKISGNVTADHALFKAVTATEGTIGPLVANEGELDSRAMFYSEGFIDRALPDRIQVLGADSNVVGAATWAHLSGGVVSAYLWVIQPLWVTIKVSGAAMLPNNCELRVGTDVTGPTTVAHNEPSWGQVGWARNLSTSGSLIMPIQFSKYVKLNPGTNTFRLMAYIVGSVQGNFNYPVLEVIPERWAKF